MVNDLGPVIERLYEGLRSPGGEARAACYTADARFSDPAFGELRGDQVGAMWRMLTSQSTGIEVDLSNVEIRGDAGSARWVARYTFGPSGRRVENRITATYRFRDGRISDHVDRFSMWRWSRQALGPIGWLLGWSPMVSRRVRRQALRNLDRFIN